MTTIKEIKDELITGTQFSNECADWFTLSNPKMDSRLISIRGEMKSYKTWDSYAKRILRLIKTGE